MEPRHIFPAGAEIANPSAYEVVRRLRRNAPPGRPGGIRSAPGRGDDDLNPGIMEDLTRVVDAAVLVPLIRHSGGLDVMLTRRTAHLSDHAGQIAFPGGRIESWDASPQSAALREAEEEVGLSPESVAVIGQLDTYLTRTGYRVTPIVGMLDPPERWRPHRYEVAEVFEVPLGFFLAPGSRKLHSRTYRGRERSYYAFPYGDYYIWGATAGMLVNLVEALSEPC